ncbi:MAG: hypothetical protein HY892_05270 [Deltaproteobacteria bacterium]|nr:hypothetical protein [Deltaproteobacteria bacterium]
MGGLKGWSTSALIHPASLQNLQEEPLFASGNGLAFTLLPSPAALIVNWPTVRGYSALILDNGGAGFQTSSVVNFTYQAALDVKRKLDLSRANRPDYAPSSSFNFHYNRAVAHLQAAASTSDEAQKGKAGQLSLDDLALATDLLLREYGITYARSQLSNRVPWIGFTLDTIDRYRNLLDLAKNIAGPYTWVRIVVDKSTSPATYAPALAYAKQIGVKVLVSPIDSYYAKGFTREAYLNQVKLFVDAFPEVEAWEVANEANGNWLGTEMGDKIADAAAYVRQKRPASFVALNLYWQIPTDAPQWSMFNWIRANLPAATRANLDIVLFSAYLEDAPLGLAFDQVMETLRAEFPQQRLGLGELDYWSADTSKNWWYVKNTDATTTARRGVAYQYYAAALGYPFSVGGVFWWYFAEEMAADPTLQASVGKVVQALEGNPQAPPLSLSIPGNLKITAP